jgi:hypothetical protein
MSFFKNLFKKQQPAGAETEVIIDKMLPSASGTGKNFRELLSHQLERFAGLSPTHAAFIDRFFPESKVNEMLNYAEQKMALSLADGKDHNVMIAQPPVCYDVTTFPFEMEEVRTHMNNQYGGFMTLLGNLMSQHPAFVTQGCNTLCLLAFGKGKGGNWVHLANVSTDELWREAGSLPVEFLNDGEQPPQKAPPADGASQKQTHNGDSSFSNKNHTAMQNDLITKENLSQQLLVDIFRDAYLNVQKAEKGENYFIKDGYSVWFEADDKGRFIKFNLLFTPNESSSEQQILRAVNQVNQEYIMYRVYKHDYGVEIDYFLWVEGGVTKKDVIFTYKFFNAACVGVVDRLAELKAIL